MEKLDDRVLEQVTGGTDSPDSSWVGQWCTGTLKTCVRGDPGVSAKSTYKVLEAGWDVKVRIYYFMGHDVYWRCVEGYVLRQGAALVPAPDWAAQLPPGV